MPPHAAFYIPSMPFIQNFRILCRKQKQNQWRTRTSRRCQKASAEIQDPSHIPLAFCCWGCHNIRLPPLATACCCCFCCVDQLQRPSALSFLGHSIPLCCALAAKMLPEKNDLWMKLKINQASETTESLIQSNFVKANGKREKLQDQVCGMEWNGIVGYIEYESIG